MTDPSEQMDQCPQVTIITIVLNGLTGIRRTLESVVNQSYEQIEYIVIDGGSTDGTLAVLQEYEERIAFWSSEPDRGISHAFNKGIERASGQIIGLLNCGDWYEDDAVARAVHTFQENPGAGVVCGMLQFWRDERKEYRSASVPALLDKEMTVTHPTCFVKASLYARYGGFSEAYQYAMDYHMLLRLKKDGIAMISLDRVLAHMTHDGISETNWLKALRETHRARRDLLPSSPYSSRVYFVFLVCKRAIRITFEKMGWEGVISFYRGRIALVKKKK